MLWRKEGRRNKAEEDWIRVGWKARGGWIQSKRKEKGGTCELEEAAIIHAFRRHGEVGLVGRFWLPLSGQKAKPHRRGPIAELLTELPTLNYYSRVRCCVSVFGLLEEGRRDREPRNDTFTLLIGFLVLVSKEERSMN